MKARFSLRGLLFLAAFVAVGLYIYQRGLLVYKTSQTLESLGAKIVYEESSIPLFHEVTRGFFRNPTEIDVSMSRISAGDLAQVGCMKKLQRITLDRKQIDQSDIQALAYCNRLVWLSAVDCRMYPGVIDDLLACQHLRYVDVHGSRIDGKSLGRFAAHPRLEKLVFDSPSHEDRSSMMNGEIIGQLAQIECLQPVGDCWISNASESDLCSFLHAPDIRLRSLSLIDCEISPVVQQNLNRASVSKLILNNCNLATSKEQMFEAPLSADTTIVFDEESRFPALKNKDFGKCGELPILKLLISPHGYELTFGTPRSNAGVELNYSISETSIIRVQKEPRSIPLAVLGKLIRQGAFEFILTQGDANVNWRYHQGNKEDYESKHVVLPIAFRSGPDSTAEIIFSMMEHAKRKGHNFSVELSADREIHSLALGGGKYWLELDREVFEQISSLQKLRSLSISLAGPVEVEMVQPLSKLQDLETFQCSELTTAASQFIQRLISENRNRRFQNSFPAAWRVNDSIPPKSDDK